MQAYTLRARLLAGRLSSVVTLGALTLGCMFLYAFDPSTSGLYPLCPFRAVTGLYCPGCGTARALHALLRGHPVKALGYNPLTILLLPVLVIWMLMDMRSQEQHRSINHRWAWGLLAAVVAFGVLRNLPVAPLRVLAP